MKVQKKTYLSKAGFRLFLLTLPFLIATLVFSYFPLFGWSYAFFDYRPGFKLLDSDFVGLKHFMAPFANAILRNDVLRVLKNTLAMSFLGLASSFLPMFFAIALSEIKSSKYRRVVQTITTVPNFISWILVYALAYAIFSVSDGFLNKLLINLGVIDQGLNILASQNHVWITMWAYGTWKSLGWSAIMYVASLSSIDSEMFEAADVDGAGRFQKIRFLTIPSLMPTFFVLLMLAIANLLNNGMDQYYVFQNAMNKQYIEVLDLYVYNNGIVGTNTSFSTAVGMLKSIISIILLFSANRLSKFVRGETIF